MVHTAEDYSGKYKLINVFGGTDVYEAAARNGSINTYDRRGKILWMDDFEGAISKWTLYGDGAGETGSLTTTSPHRGSQCYKMVTGAADTNTVGIKKVLQYPQLKRLGFEVSIAQPASHRTQGIYVVILTGTESYTAGIQLLATNEVVQYYNSAGTWTTAIDPMKTSGDSTIYHTMKFVIDLGTLEYVRMMYQQSSADLSGIPIKTATVAANPRITIYAEGQTWSAGASTYRVDNFILTQDEP